MKDNVFFEFGIDFDNNKYAIGYSAEVENPDGSEQRYKKFIPMKNKSFYLRIWLGKKVWVFTGKGVVHLVKKRNNFKIVFGLAGIKK